MMIVSQVPIPPVDLWPKLIDYGLTGLLLYWFAMRSEKRTTSLEKSVDFLSKAQLLTLSKMENLDAGTRTQVEGLLDELARKERKE